VLEQGEAKLSREDVIKLISQAVDP
jgi:hypothetical protein